jgi:hypothetical protein
MDAVLSDPGLYVAYAYISEEYEAKFNWIYQKGGRCGHFDIPTRYYRLKTAEELKQDEIFVSKIKCDTMVATFGDMCYLDKFPKSLHKYFDYTLELRHDHSVKERVNASEYLGNYNYAKINIMRNSTPLIL